MGIFEPQRSRKHGSYKKSVYYNHDYLGTLWDVEAASLYVCKWMFRNLGDSVHMEQKWSYSESLSESVVFLLIDQSNTANDRESHFGLGYQKLSM